MAKKPGSLGLGLAVGFLLGLLAGVALTVSAVWFLPRVPSLFPEREARCSNLITDLQTIRSQLLLYKTQHNEVYPGADFTAQLTHFTDIAGKASRTETGGFRFGPYLQQIPANPFSRSSVVEIVSDPAAEFKPPAKDGGWWFNSATGEFRANLTDNQKDDDGQPLNSL